MISSNKCLIHFLALTVEIPKMSWCPPNYIQLYKRFSHLRFPAKLHIPYVALENYALKSREPPIVARLILIIIPLRELERGGRVRHVARPQSSRVFAPTDNLSMYSPIFSPSSLSQHFNGWRDRCRALEATKLPGWIDPSDTRIYTRRPKHDVKADTGLDFAGHGTRDERFLCFRAGCSRKRDAVREQCCLAMMVL